MAKLVSLAWYSGKHGVQEPGQPTLLICYDNGRFQVDISFITYKYLYIILSQAFSGNLITGVWNGFIWTTRRVLDF